MSEKPEQNEGYLETCGMTAELVHAASSRPERPAFRFPPTEIALVASVVDVGQLLCINDAARILLDELLSETKRRGLADYPTALMLRSALEMFDVPIVVVSLSELGLKVGRA